MATNRSETDVTLCVSQAFSLSLSLPLSLPLSALHIKWGVLMMMLELARTPALVRSCNLCYLCPPDFEICFSQGEKVYEM